MKYLDDLRAQLAAIIQEQRAAKAELDKVLDGPEAEGRTELTEADEKAFTAALAEARSKVDACEERMKPIKENIAHLQALEDAESRALAMIPPAARPGNVRVKSEERTYSKAAEAAGTSFLTDVVARHLGDFDASQRLSRHMSEERVHRPGVEQRAVATSNFAGLVVPQYLTDLVAPTARAGRPFADICRNHPLPASGMTVNISRITTATTVTAASENAAASETGIDDTLLSPAVITLSGQQTVSRQAIDRGTGVEQIVLADLVGALNTKVDDTLINTATTGLDAVTDANVDVAYTDASPTAAELWPKLWDAVQQIQTAAYGGPTHFLMHPRRWAWLNASVGTSFPFMNISRAPQTAGTLTDGGYGRVVGDLGGYPVVTDANITIVGGGSTNEDRIYVVNAQECHLWEDDTMFIRAEQTAAASLGVLLVVYKYMAYTFSRYVSANGRIAGTGLATPSF